MDQDDPGRAEFASWDSYEKFSRRIRFGRRYVWPRETRAFLDTVLATLKDRDRKITKGVILYRAQIGVDYDKEEAPLGFGAARMKPLANRAKQGRVNVPGIPVLYLASTKKIAISEVRPWAGSEISLAQFSICRDLKAVDLSLGHGNLSIGHLTFAQLEGKAPLDAGAKEKAVWIDIDNAFSRPVMASDDVADYVPTQILSEIFWGAGYDAILYRSQFDKIGYNVAVREVSDAKIINCTPYTVKAIDVKFTQSGNTWFVSTKKSSRRRKRR
jgi:RES domain-containing protein